MDVKIRNKNIVLSMVRGDTEGLLVKVIQKDSNGKITNIPLVNGDKVYFTVKKSSRDEEFLFQVVETSFENGEAIISIYPYDTKDLDFGTYVYDIQVTFANGTIRTVVPKSDFIITDEVTYD